MHRISIKTKLADEVSNYLRKAILEGEMPPGHHIVESVVSTHLNVSRGPVRDAILQLEAEGMVHTQSNGRTVVTKFDMKDFEDYISLRFYLEFEACKKIIAAKDYDDTLPAWFAQQRSELRRLNVECDANRDEEINRADYRFHDQLIQKADSVILLKAWTTIAGMRRSLMETNLKHFRTQTSRGDYVRIHSEILDSIEAGNLEDSATKLQHHYTQGRHSFGETLRMSQREETEKSGES